MRRQPKKLVEKIKKFLESLGYVCLLFDQMLFLKFNDDGELEGIIIIHIDDLILSGDEASLRLVIQQVTANFNISKVKEFSEKCMKHVGVMIVKLPEEIKFNQIEMMKNIKPIKITTERQVDQKVTTEELREQKRVLGQILY